MTTFIRLLETAPDRKAATMANAIARWRLGEESAEVFEVDPSSFQQLPGSALVYWMSQQILNLFSDLPPLATNGRELKQGLVTSDDFRFVRAWWEVEALDLGRSWFPFVKASSRSPFYTDFLLVVNWARGGEELWAVYEANRARVGGIIKNPGYYFRPGLTWPARPHLRGWFSIVPKGCVFSSTGMMLYPAEGEQLQLLSLLNSGAFIGLLHLLMARGTQGGQTLKYELGYLASVPMPAVPADLSDQLRRLADEAIRVQRRTHSGLQTSHSFTYPETLHATGPTLATREAAWRSQTMHSKAKLVAAEAEIDDVAFRLYGISNDDRRQIDDGFSGVTSSGVEADTDPDTEDQPGAVQDADSVALVEALLEWALGTALGRFDIRLAIGERQLPSDPDPVDALPMCSPGMLQSESGLPVSDAPDDYPLELPPHGILVDDPGHVWDVVARIEAVLQLVAGELAHAWIHEIEATVGRDLRDWLRRLGFERHLKRYSLNRRKAPIFWHLGPKSREYGLWVYSPAATRDTLFRIQNDYVEPKLKASERRLIELSQHAGANPSSQQRKSVATENSIVEELRSFREQVALVAPLWTPFRDDGVILNCAVLSRLFSHQPWQNECATRWRELSAGKFDWAHCAMHLWPDRVVGTCARNRSIAISHGLAADLWEESEDGKWTPRADAAAQSARLVAARQSPALRSSLNAYVRAG